jgi:hypothetical protein
MGQQSNLAPLVVNTDELEQVLSASTKINMAEVDKSLAYFLRQCFSIRESIKQFLKQSLGRYLVYAESDVAEYCLLLINDELIKSFKVNSRVGGAGGNGLSGLNAVGGGGSATSSSSSISAGEVSSSSSSSLATTTQQQQQQLEIKSFILVKFDKPGKNTTLLQVNRVKVARADELREESSGSGETDSSHFGAKSSINRLHLNFTMNLLSFAFWESIFATKEK